jgi:two-component system NtrC family sensor kinase
MTPPQASKAAGGPSAAELEQRLQAALSERDEALERQTATADILRVISQSPTDVQPVFEAIVQTAVRLLRCDLSGVLLHDGSTISPVTTATREGLLTDLGPRNFPIDPAANFPSRAILAKQNLYLPDWSKIELPEHERQIHAHYGMNSGLYLPLLRSGECIGLLFVGGTRPNIFGPADIALAESFRDQALIAIENTRMFNETQQALERQTATADILKVIARSPDDVQPVFQAIAERSNRLVDGRSTAVYRIVDNMQHLMAFTPVNPAADAALRAYFPAPLSTLSNAHEAIRNGEIFVYVDNEVELAAEPARLAVARQRGWRSALLVPLLRDRKPIGLITVSRADPGTFTPHHVQLLQTFADQAVIAVENTRLFNETQEALEQQTATADILKVIARSPDDVQPVFQAIADRSNRLVDGLSTTVFTLVGDMMHLVAFTRSNPQADAALEAMFPAPLSNWSWGEAIRSGEVYRVLDTETETDRLRELARLRGYRSMLFVPLLRDGVPIGVIGQTRVEPGPFADHHVQLLRTFADQAVIAISNVGLFQQVQQRPRELTASLDELRTAQDRLVQTEKLASLGQLTAGIAHEIKNPLNFVNNFSALSAELVDELDEALAPLVLDDKTRGDIGELTQILKGNLEKVVQHGKRADSIVKNMLLHSREGGGEHRATDINALVEESLNLAYHGARAERPGFNITLHRAFDPAVGTIDLYPQEITRVLLNVISNGFYATTKRQAAAGDGFEPMLTTTTKNLGKAVEIRIRDNGTGIPDEVKEKMFNPFFTTKPAGEGTGLGLSMSHDIVVKQHGGRIDVITESGAFTEFIITLPRAVAAQT